MKTVKYTLLVIIGSLVFTACNKYDFLNLKRDNPLDGKNNANIQGGVVIKFDSYYVVSDNNDDKIINKGETVKLNIGLKNIGTSSATGIKAAFSTTSSYVSGFTPSSQVSYGDISAGSTAWKGYFPYSDFAFQFTVSSSTPTNTNILINISIVDESNNTWSSSFNVNVQ